jgi:hypothetical protein
MGDRDHVRFHVARIGAVAASGTELVIHVLRHDPERPSIVRLRLVPGRASALPPVAARLGVRSLRSLIELLRAALDEIEGDGRDARGPQ